MLNNYSKEDKALLAVDCIIFGFDGEDLKVLLIKRDFEPEKGKWSLIGGFLKKEEDETKITKLNFYVWQRYANSIWDDIREGNVLPFKDTKEEDDEKHVTPTQLDVIDRIVEMYSNTNEVVLTPFMGVGSEVYSPVSLGRKAIGIELKDSYYKQAILNLKDAYKRQLFGKESNQLELL